MAFNIIIVFFITSVLPASVIGALRPRGVSLHSKVFYDPSQHFRCLDGSGSFPFYFVNDDFCDCDDGSDEPGTSACSNGIFNCLNYGHDPVSLPSSRVNDGICDCCDSTDEYNSKADCFNYCKELGQEAVAKAKLTYEIFIKGQEIRNNYIKLGKEKKEESRVLLDKLYQQELEATKVKNEKQDQKENAETLENMILSKEREMKKAQERKLDTERRALLEKQQQEEAEGQKVFKELDVNKDGKLTSSEIKSFVRFDYDGDGKVSENEALFYMQKKKEMSLEEFLNNGWKVMKQAYTVNELDEQIPFKKDEKVDLNIEKFYYDEPIEKINTKEKNKILKDAAMAKKDFADADKLLQDIESEIWYLKRKIKSDFGEDDEFLVLESQCFDLPDKKYLYKVCPFDKIVQIVKVNKDETLIGVWDKWSGTGKSYYQQMHYNRGAACWHGHTRSAEVNLQCGVINKVTSVVETSPCSYIFEFTTPASCKELPQYIDKLLKNDIDFL